MDDYRPAYRCIFCDVDKANGEPWEIAATYYAIGMSSGAHPHDAPLPCETHVHAIVLGAALLGKVCEVPQEDIDTFTRGVREKMQ